jgi:hypothetical protein
VTIELVVAQAGPALSFGRASGRQRCALVSEPNAIHFAQSCCGQKHYPFRRFPLLSVCCLLLSHFLNSVFLFLLTFPAFHFLSWMVLYTRKRLLQQQQQQQQQQQLQLRLQLQLLVYLQLLVLVLVLVRCRFKLMLVAPVLLLQSSTPVLHSSPPQSSTLAAILIPSHWDKYVKTRINADHACCSLAHTATASPSVVGTSRCVWTWLRPRWWLTCSHWHVKSFQP